MAIDLSSIEWAKLNGPWSTEARDFVASFGLTRPYSPEANTYCIKEHWHFELGEVTPPEEQPPGTQPKPPVEHGPEETKVTNTDNALLVDDPVHWDDEAHLLRKLPIGSRVTVLDKGTDKSFNRTAGEYQWWYVEIKGTKGWAMQTLLD